VRVLPARLNDKPHYVFHPRRVLRRVFWPPTGMSSAGAQTAVCALPWGLPLRVWAQEAIGYSIFTAGVFDPCVTETIHRLVDPGDLVVDAGANIGYLTSLAMARSGAGGTVVAYEPHPAVFELLERNASIWRLRSGLAQLELRRVALSDRTGDGRLVAGSTLQTNMGLATLEESDTARADDLVSVELRTLDDEIGDRSVGLLKIDVEGHELQVLRGATRLLEQGLIRDVIFEHHAPYPDAATEIVEGAGYAVFSLHNDLLGLYVTPPSHHGRQSGWPGPSYLATRDPERARARLAPLGWQVSSIGPRAPAALSQLRSTMLTGRLSRSNANGRH
jgi:FkbM family methyltransferase